MKLSLIFVLLFSITPGFASDLGERKQHIQKMAEKNTTESINRKARSEKILKQYGVPINEHLPFIEGSSEALIRTKEEVAMRAMALLIVAFKAEGLEQDIVEKLIVDYDLESTLSPNEKKFIDDLEPSKFDKTQFIWRYEAAWVLLWSLGYVEELSMPDGICDVPKAVSLLKERTHKEFIDDANIRSIASLLDENDLIYRYHWAVVDARVNGLEIPESINSSVVLERHYALNWLIGYLGQQWDDISTDT